MGIEMTSNFTLQANMPLDSREVVVNIAERNSIPEHMRYEGMVVFVTSTKKNYQLVGGTGNSEWSELSSSGTEKPDEIIVSQDVPPERTDVFWVNTAEGDEGYSYVKEPILESFSKSITELKKDVRSLNIAVFNSIDGGLFEEDKNVEEILFDGGGF